MKGHRRIAVSVTLAVLSFVSSPGTDAATTPWAAKANSVCIAWKLRGKAIFGTTQPKSIRELYLFMVKARPFEVGELAALEKIPEAPAAASRAFRYAKADIREMDAAIAAYQAHKGQAFVDDLTAWQSDHRTSRAFIAAGAPSCV
jgi:hypothetical protein